MSEEVEFNIVVFKDDGRITAFVGACNAELKWSSKATEAISEAKELLSRRRHSQELLDRATWFLYSPIGSVPHEDLHNFYEKHHEGSLYNNLLSNHFDDSPSYFLLRGKETIKNLNKRNRRIIVVFEPPDDDPRDAFTPRAILRAIQDRPSPSDAAKLSTRRTHQSSANPGATYGARPPSLFSAPLSIYHSIFFEFTRALSMPQEPSPKDLEFAQSLVHQSLRFYTDEAERRNAIGPYLNKLLGTTTAMTPYDLPQRHLNTSTRGRAPQADGFVSVELDKSAFKLGAAAATTLIVELKNEVGEGGCEPMAQAYEDYQCVCAGQNYDLVCALTRAPCFLLSIAGPYISIGGIVLADSFISECFTDLLYMGPRGHDTSFSNTTRRIAQILLTLRDSLHDLNKFYQNVMFPYRKETADSSNPSVNLPAFEVDAFPAPSYNQFESEGKTWKLTYHGRLESRSRKPIFRATCTSTSDESEQHSVVVKFTDRYSEQAHRLLANAAKPLAPKLRSCERWHEMRVIVMDFVATVDLEKATPPRMQVLNDIQTGLGILHSADLVHGDIRKPNILVTRQGGLIIDFDWGGKAGEASYPFTLNPEITWPEGAHRGGTITQAHDTFMMKELKVGWLGLRFSS